VARLFQTPTDEQAEALDLFLRGDSLKINAYAGTGKTTTLQMLAAATRNKGQYLAFNRGVVKEAAAKFPSNVDCSTSHALAYRALRSRFSNAKLIDGGNAYQLAEVLELEPQSLSRKQTLSPRAQASLLIATIKTFAQSDSEGLLANHVPKASLSRLGSEAAIHAIEAFTLQNARKLWARMIDPNDALPLGHDGYLKLWALSQPKIEADFILLDEAQDTNPVVLDILKSQQAQMIYVGDKYQQIYEWRGAVNAMEAMTADRTVYLTESFRFGEAIASLATQILFKLGETRPLRGNPDIRSEIRDGNAATILTRTNATSITAIIEALDAGHKPHLIGGCGEMITLLESVYSLKQGEGSSAPEFFGFNTWHDVVDAARSDEGEQLLPFVNLVEAKGEQQLLWALHNSVGADECDVVISTAHKAKGREWPSIRLTDDFMKSARPSRKKTREKLDPSELRLLYVAVTRAKTSISLSPALRDFIGGREDKGLSQSRARKASKLMTVLRRLLKSIGLRHPRSSGT